MLPLPPGTRASYTMVVSPEHLASRFKDPTLPPVLATPVMILAMENAALEALKPYLQPGESAVGSHVNVAHLAATPLGAPVTATATVTGVSGRKITFAVHASDGTQDIGRGTHERVLIDMKKFAARLGGAGRQPPTSPDGPASPPSGSAPA